jgi:hypothetical protein
VVNSALGSLRTVSRNKTGESRAITHGDVIWTSAGLHVLKHLLASTYRPTLHLSNSCCELAGHFYARMFTRTEHLIISSLILENGGISCFQDDITIEQNFDLAANGYLAVTPHPNHPRVFGGKTLYKATIGGAQFEFEAHDYDQVFNNFLSDDLRGSREAEEGHRCFYLCLGRALRIHPFVLASCFRLIAKQLPDIFDETVVLGCY